MPHLPKQQHVSPGVLTWSQARRRRPAGKRGCPRSRALAGARGEGARALQGYLAHKKMPTPLRTPLGP